MTPEGGAIAQLFLQIDGAFERDTENDAERLALLLPPVMAIAQIVVIDINRIANALERVADAQWATYRATEERTKQLHKTLEDVERTVHRRV